MTNNRPNSTALLITMMICLTVILTAYIFAQDAPQLPSAPREATETVKDEPCAHIPEPVEIWEPDPRDVYLIAKTLYGECRGVASTAQQAAVAWCILNRVDAEGYACGVSIEYVVTFPEQFSYAESAPVTEQLQALAYDVLIRWHAESNGAKEVGRTLPREYKYFVGDGTQNHFSVDWKSKSYWDWSLPSPYES